MQRCVHAVFSERLLYMFTSHVGIKHFTLRHACSTSTDLNYYSCVKLWNNFFMSFIHIISEFEDAFISHFLFAILTLSKVGLLRKPPSLHVYIYIHIGNRCNLTCVIFAKTYLKNDNLIMKHRLFKVGHTDISLIITF